MDCRKCTRTLSTVQDHLGRQAEQGSFIPESSEPQNHFYRAINWSVSTAAKWNPHMQILRETTHHSAELLPSASYRFPRGTRFPATGNKFGGPLGMNQTILKDTDFSKDLQGRKDRHSNLTNASVPCLRSLSAHSICQIESSSKGRKHIFILLIEAYLTGLL